MPRRRSAAIHPLHDGVADERYVRQVIERIVADCPRRLAGTADEERAQRLLARRFADLGISWEMHPFTYHHHLYGSLALHFGVGTLGSLLFGVAPAASLALHTLAGASYYGSSTRRFELLRRLLPRRDSHNLVATLPADGEADPALRIVLIAHADAAYTGLVFDPRLVKRLAGRGPSLPPLDKPLRLTTCSQFALAGVDALGVVLGPVGRQLLWPAVGLLSVPGLLAFALNMEVVLRDQAVPGANDNLSGCAALGVLAGRLAPRKRADVELVFVDTGAEESGTMGAMALARQMRDRWDRSRTVIVAVDGMTNGTLRYFLEGELRDCRVPPDLAQAALDAARGDERLQGFGPYRMPVGSTDAAPFHRHGYDCISIGCADPTLGSPRHYHHPDDTPANLDMRQLMASIDFVERFVDLVVERRLGPPGP